ncbi:GAF domain-containing sensor histidine kinase [bacterium]|nr:GAF domain-containing sensor histidine kinase [bacterium]
MKSRHSTITIREKNESKTVTIGADNKPTIVEEVMDKWQSLINAMAKAVGVPSGLIMKLNESTIEVFLKSDTQGNPYEVGEEAKLIYGLYCETVIGTQDKLIVTDASKSPIWKANNPDVDINMISYLGYPINWPDGEVFGTVCLLDSKENGYSELYSQLLFQVKQHMETDLQQLLSHKALEEANQKLQKLNGVNARFIALISHDVRGSVGVVANFLKLILSNYESYEKNKLKKILLNLSNSASHVFNTLENLLRWSKNDLLDLKAHKRNLNLVEILQNILKFFKFELTNKEILLIKEYYANDVTLFCDADMIETALRNIISNAIKFTHNKGSIVIRILKGDNHTIIEIEDNGIGMNQEAIQNLYSYSESHSKGTEGELSSGIGLLITKEFLDKNGADIQVKSELGNGTTFRITI